MLQDTSKVGSSHYVVSASKSTQNAIMSSHTCVDPDLSHNSLICCMEDQRYESDFWEWIDEGMSGEDEQEEDVHCKK